MLKFLLNLFVPETEMSYVYGKSSIYLIRDCNRYDVIQVNIRLDQHTDTLEFYCKGRWIDVNSVFQGKRLKRVIRRFKRDLNL